MTLEEIRKQYPQYQHLSNETLALSLHKKFYPNVPFQEFAKKIGYVSTGETQIDRTTGLTNLPMRIKMSFVEDSDQKLKYLRTIYPSAHYTTDGQLVYENPETGKMTAVDEEGVSLKDMADWVGMIPEVAGATAGSLATAWIPVPGARVAGAGIGYSAGREMKGWAAEAVTGTEHQRLALEEYRKQKGREMAVGAAGELLGVGLQKAASPFAKNVTSELKRSIDYFRAYGGRMTPAQATESRVLDLLENIAESSLFGGGKIRTFKLAQKELTENIADDIVRGFGRAASPEELGIAVQAAIEGKKGAFNKAARVIFKKVDELTGGVQVSTTPLKQEASRLLKRLSPTTTEIITETQVSPLVSAIGLPIEREVAKETTRTLTPSLKNKTTVRMLKDFANLPDSVPFSHLQQWRSDLLQIGYAPTDLIPGKTQGMAKHLSKTIDRIFNKAEGGLSGEALTAFREANAFWRTGKETFNNRFVKSIAQSQPEKVVNSIFKPGVTTNIRMIKNLVGGETSKQLERAFAQKLIFEESVSGMGSGFPEGAISGRKISAVLRKYGESTLKEAFGAEKLKEIEHFASTLSNLQKRTPYLGGGLFIQLQQSGAIMEMLGMYGIGAGFTKAGAAVLIGPRALSELFTRPTTIKWLTEGLLVRKGSKEAARLTGRIMGAITINTDDIYIVPKPEKIEPMEMPIP